MKNSFNSELKDLRNQIDLLDLEICNALAKRFTVVEEIAILKRKYQNNKMSVSRQSKITNTLVNKTLLPRKFVLNLYTIIFEYSIEKQKSVINKK